jgi:putative transposase
MPNSRRFHLAGIPQHVVQRGNSRQLCFLANADYSEYLRRLARASQKHAVAVHAYVLMTNHVHLLVTPATADGVAKLMQSVGTGYVRSFNARRGRTGTLWDGRFYSALVDSDRYFWGCHRYIELNPVRAGMVARPGDYKWSSYAANAHGKPDPVVTPHASYLALAGSLAKARANYRQMFANQLVEADLQAIRNSVRNERAYGREEFFASIEAHSIRSPRHRGRGRPIAIDETQT